MMRVTVSALFGAQYGRGGISIAAYDSIASATFEADMPTDTFEAARPSTMTGEYQNQGIAMAKA
jgi:hypothetical protein